MSRIGLPELIIIFLAVVLLFGAKALPDIAKGLGQAVKNFKKSLKEDDDTTEKKPDDPKGI